MYIYLYDNFLRQKKFDATIKAIETRLTDFGIAGKIVRLQPFTTPEAVIDEERKRGATTAVIVGNDATFGRIISRAATSEMLFGYIPIGAENSIAEVLGIPEGVTACDVLSRRRKLKLDIGWIANRNRFFISSLYIPPALITVVYDERFQVSSRNGKMELTVSNLDPQHARVHPQNGKLEAYIRPLSRQGIFREVYEEPSTFPFEEMIVTGDRTFAVEADGTITKEKKIVIRLAKKKIEVIVGKERKF